MTIYNLYAGLSGGFGGYSYYCTEEYENHAEAEEVARQLAIEEYESYEGCHGIRSFEDVKNDYIEENGFTDEEDLNDQDYDNIQEEYQDDIEGWIVYAAFTVEEDPDCDQCSNY